MHESVLGIWVVLAPVSCGHSCTARGTIQSSSGWFTKTSCEIYSWFPNQLLACSPAHLALAFPESPCPAPKMMNGVLLMMKKKQEREDQELPSELIWVFRHYSFPCLSFLALKIWDLVWWLLLITWRRKVLDTFSPVILITFFPQLITLGNRLNIMKQKHIKKT